MRVYTQPGKDKPAGAQERCPELSTVDTQEVVADLAEKYNIQAEYVRDIFLKMKELCNNDYSVKVLQSMG